MSRHGLLAGVLVCALTACGGSERLDGESCGLRLSSESNCPAGRGTVELHFAVSEKARKSSFLVDPLKGTVYGFLLRPEYVGAGGPTSEAVATHYVRVDGVDFTANNDPGVPSAQSSTASVCAGKYEFLGFLDVDGNATEPAMADRGDPVTTPGGAKAQQFEVKENSHTEQTLTFDMTLVCTVTCLNPAVCLL